MFPILYESNETAFSSNGLGRLRDVIEAKVVEERNGVYELDFQYPVSAEDFSDIQIGRIVGVTHDDSEDIQPFDIVSFTRPIDGIVTFHCTHISYRQSYLTVTGSNINNLASAFTLLGTSTPANPFTYQTDKPSTGYLASADGIPKTVRSMLGGVEGSILDAYGGEYEWDKFNVILHSSRGVERDFSIRYGVNMLDYNEELDNSGTYSSCIPYWTDGTLKVIGDRQDSGNSTITGRDECVPLDVSDKFESKPTKAKVNDMGLSVMNAKNPTMPSQTIHVEFVRLQDLGYEDLSNLYHCKLCDSINVVFPFYNTTGRFKIVKTVWDVLADRYESMELGDLSATLSEALGIANTNNNGTPESSGWAYANVITATTISAQNTPTKVPLTGLAAGSGFSYDSTNKGIKCDKAGWYMASVSVRMSTATDGNTLGLLIYKNGSAQVGPEYTRIGGNNDNVLLFPTPISLAEGDYLTLYIRNNSAASGVTSTGCRLSLWQI